MLSSIKFLVAAGCLVNFGLLLLLNSGSESQTFSKYEDAPLLELQQSKPWEVYMNSLTLISGYQGLVREEDYCAKVAAYRAAHPIRLDARGVPVREDRVFFSDYSRRLLVKQILADYGQLTLPRHIAGIEGIQIDEEPLDPSIVSFVQLIPSWHLNFKIGTHFLCEGQRYNHIPGNGWLNYKDVAANSLRKYNEHYIDRPQCFDAWRVMPYTLDLTQTAQCFEFLDALYEAVRTRSIQWIVKVSRNSHNGKGLTLVDQATAQMFLDTLQCPTADFLIAQRYIEDPFLINNKKFDFRAYLVIASMDPLMILYHDGFVKISLDEYDAESSEITAHLTNTKVAETKVKALNITAAEQKTMLKDQGWSFEHFEEYMFQTHGTEAGWMGSVRTYLKQTMFHLVRMNLDKLLRHPQVYELYGLDFLLDSNLHLWFIETNLTPSIGSTTEEKKAVNVKLMRDLLDLQFALQFGGDFDGILHSSNFEWIFDGRKAGYARYHNTIPPECI